MNNNGKWLILAGTALFLLATFLPSTFGFAPLSTVGGNLVPGANCGNSGLLTLQPLFVTTTTLTTPCGTFPITLINNQIPYAAGSNTFSVPATVNGQQFSCWILTNIQPYTTAGGSIAANAGNPSITLTLASGVSGQQNLNPVYNGNWSGCANAITIGGGGGGGFVFYLGQVIGLGVAALGIFIGRKKD